MTAIEESPRIVVGVDGSPSSADALRWAVRQARLTGARVDAVAAWEMQPVFGWALAIPDEGAPVRAGSMLATCVAGIVDEESPQVEIDQHVVQGPPAKVLLGLADGAELLVVGTRGHGPLTEALLGSVGGQCVHRAHCPVVIVHGQSDSGEKDQEAGEPVRSRH